ncbi:hypothetical protein [Paraburkholderia susongensis]|uniref:ParB-like nuclease domain-containing protein n=1 Tax=Paraburkholderia susongensis TaxID=1515439 RepID=A0A1X7I6U1_9BURK|nr:hypothetical protein [Paraburkholderia susongensis]SMG09823.1 hypothetical protein SAMN06265784_101349 [Paraburkholderia susongensis]
MTRNPTLPLELEEPIVTGNTKAAVRAAGGKSSDLWMIPYDQLHWNQRDNVRPLDIEWAKHLGELIKVNGFDKNQPLGGFVRKVNDEDRIYIWQGQHRYHGAGLAIQAGVDLGLIPVIIIAAEKVSHPNLIFGGLTGNASRSTTPLELGAKIIELRDAYGIDMQTIRSRLNITEQTVRDVLLLAGAPPELRELVHTNTVASTAAIEQIRKHGPEKALERIGKAASDARSAGRTRVTRKDLEPPEPQRKGKPNKAEADTIVTPAKSPDALFSPGFRHDMPRVQLAENIWYPSYCADVIANAGTSIAVVKPFTHGDRLWVCVGGLHDHSYHEGECWSLCPIDDWKGSTFIGSQLDRAVEAGAHERGSYRGQVVQVRGEKYVLDAVMLCYAGERMRSPSATVASPKAHATDATPKITGEQAKSLWRALQAVLHDDGFALLDMKTIQSVHAALLPLADLPDHARIAQSAESSDVG